MTDSKSLEMKLELGHRATKRDKPTPEGFTHDWQVFVKGAEGSEIQHFVDKAVFLLHDNYPKPKRVIKKPPYQVSESGYTGFIMPIEVYFRSKEEPKKVRFEYDLFMQLEDSPVYNIRRENLTFQNPSDDFRRKLLKARGGKCNIKKLSAANSSFALKLHLLLCKDKEQKNVFFSPFSISVALSMLLRGAKEKTAAEIHQVLGFDFVELKDAEIHSSFNELLSVLLKCQTSYVLSIANAIVCQKDFPILPDYKSDLQEVYRALAMEVDFAKESASAVKQINDWVCENTKGKISKLFDNLSPATVIVLLNAVYFKGTWQHQFDNAATRDGVFYNHGIEAKQVPLMYMKEHFPFVEKGNYKVLELPYVGDDIAMLLFLPHEKNGLASLESNLKDDFIKAIRSELFKTEVKVTIPKLHIEYSKQLIPILKSLGMQEVFTFLANLQGLNESDQLTVSQVLHKAVLDVNEEGSEAAAVTAVVVERCCALVNQCAEFKADHPFLFVIYHKPKNLVLFMGRIENL